MSAFDDFLADVEAEREWLLELDALPLNTLSADSAAFGDGGFEEFGFEEDAAGETGGQVTLYYSSGGYASKVGAVRDYLSLPGSVDDGAWASFDVDAINDFNGDDPAAHTARFTTLGGTFTRAGATATRVNAQGLIETVAADMLRLDHDPVTHARKGFLIEEARTNKQPNSVVDDTWNINAGGGTINFGIAPDGTFATFQTAAATANRYKGAAVDIGATYTYSIHVKCADADPLKIYIDGLFGAANAFADAQASWVNPLAAPVLEGLATRAVATKLKSGLYRLEVTFTTQAAGVANGYVYPNTANPQEWWGAQIEDGDRASSYIPTAGAAVTRNADVAQVSDISGFYNAAEGSIFAEFDMTPSTTAPENIAEFNDGTSGERLVWYADVDQAVKFAVEDDPTGIVANFANGVAISAQTVCRIAAAYKLNDLAFSVNGNAVTTDTAATLPNVTSLDLGKNSIAAYLNGHLRRFTYFPKRLSSATLQALSLDGPALVRRTVYGQDPASLQQYDGRIAGEPTVRRSVIDGQSAQGGLAGGLGGLVQCFAEIELVNADGGLDQLSKSYALDGRAAKLYMGSPGAARVDFGVVFAGVNAKTPLTGSKVATLSLSDGLARLLVPLNASTYGGTGGLEGDADLAGKPKPKCWGSTLNVSPPLVDHALLIYQVHDGLANDVPMVYDRAVTLVRGADYATQNDLLTVAPAAGQYRVWKDASGSYFRLGASPDGTVTADVEGDATGGYVSTTGDIVNRVLQIVLQAAEIDAAAIAQLNADAPAVVGIWRGPDPETVAGVVSALLVGVGAFGGFNRSALFTCAVIGIGAATVAAFTDEEIGDVEREALPGAIEPIVWRTRVAWQRNNTVQTDVAAGVSDARRAFVAQAERVAERNEPATKSRRRLAREYGPNGELYATQADAQAEADRRLALFGVERGLYTLPLPARAMSRDIGETIKVTYPRFGLTGGVSALILEHQIVGDAVTVKVLV